MAPQNVTTDEFPEHIDDPSFPLLGIDELRAIIVGNLETYSDRSLGSLVIADGYKLSLLVRNDQLVIDDGVFPDKRQRTISALDANITVRTVLVLGAGYITTEAMLWCIHHNVTLAVCRYGELPTMLSTPALYDKSGLRRAQARLAGSPKELPVFRHIAEKRLSGMLGIAQTFSDASESTLLTIKKLLTGLGEVSSITTIRAHEGKVASIYWPLWRSLELQFSWPAPAHWRTFETRRSETGSTNRRNNDAIRPVNALLNFGYKVAETQATIAMIGVGLDPGMGIVHEDTGVVEGRSRHRMERMSGALEVLECGRSVVERFVLELVRSRRFGRADFRRLPNSVLRVGPPLSHQIATELAPELGEVLTTESEWLARTLSGKR